MALLGPTFGADGAATHNMQETPSWWFAPHIKIHHRLPCVDHITRVFAGSVARPVAAWPMLPLPRNWNGSAALDNVTTPGGRPLEPRPLVGRQRQFAGALLALGNTCRELVGNASRPEHWRYRRRAQLLGARWPTRRQRRLGPPDASVEEAVEAIPDSERSARHHAEYVGTSNRAPDADRLRVVGTRVLDPDTPRTVLTWSCSHKDLPSPSHIELLAPVRFHRGQNFRRPSRGCCRRTFGTTAAAQRFRCVGAHDERAALDHAASCPLGCRPGQTSPDARGLGTDESLFFIAQKAVSIGYRSPTTL